MSVVELDVIGAYAGIHHIDDGSRSGAAAVEAAVELTLDLVDPVEMPENVVEVLVAAIFEDRDRVPRVEEDLPFEAACWNAARRERYRRCRYGA